MKNCLLLVAGLIVSWCCWRLDAVADDAGSVQVFILAGQSNMEGKAPNALFDYQATDPKTKNLFAHLRKDDKWVVRDDVFIRFLDRHGPLTIGFGSPDRTGPELGFGAVMGNYFSEPVLLIKTAWGGHSLVKYFRSPSAGFPSEGKLQEECCKLNNESNRTTKRTRQACRCPRWPISKSSTARRTAIC